VTTNIRTLSLSKEMKVFLAVTGFMSVLYLGLHTGEQTRKGVKTFGTPPDLETGKMVDVSITLITADASGLACSSDQQIGPMHCAFKADGRPWPKEEGEAGSPENIIAPYMTVDNTLFLVPGLWTEPALAKRLVEEPPTKFDREQLRRFNANCKMKVEGKMNSFKVRWQPGTPWGDRDAAWVGRLSGCTLQDA
jgi:hypothetical protein